MPDLSFENPGGIPSPYDYRNVPNGMIATAIPLPESYKLDIAPFPIWHQRKLGACVGHALAKAGQIYFYQKTGKVINFSPRFLYAMAKAQDGILEEGTYPSLVAKIFNQVGCATEATCPNDTTLDHETYVYQRLTANIPRAARDEAAQYKIPGYAFVNTQNEDDVKRAIFEGSAIAGLLRIGKEWWTGADGFVTWDEGKILPLLPPASIISGHEIVLYGFDTSNFKDLINSWSSEWAHQGTGWFDYQKYKPYFIEAIVIRDLPAPVIEELKQLPPKPKHTFLVNMELGQKNDEIVFLQQCLKYEGLFPVATPSTGYYGDITRQAVLAFQKKYGISPAAQLLYRGRYCYEHTRMKLNQLYA